MKDASGFVLEFADQLSDGIIVADESGLAFVNSRALLLLGADRPEDVMGKSLALWFETEVFQNIFRPMTFQGRGDDGTPIIGRILRSDGKVVEVRVTSRPILWDGGQSCLLLVVRTEPRLAVGKHAIDHSDVNSTPSQAAPCIGRWERDLNTGAEVWSDGQYRILGYEPGGILPAFNTFVKVIHEDDQDRVVDAFAQAVISDTPCDVECRIVQPNGTLRVIRCRGVVVRNTAGDPIRLLGTTHEQMTDVRIETLSERAVRESREQLDLVTQAAHAGSFEWDHRTGYFYCSSIFRDICGMNSDTPASLRRYVKMIDRMDRERIVSAIRTGKNSASDGHFQIEHRIVRPDGTIRHIRLHSLTRIEGEGPMHAPSRTLGAIIDITDHVLADACRRESSQMETIGILAGGIAHEFNNHLTAVLGFSQLALPLIPADSKARRHIQQVIAAGRTSSEFIHQLLMFIRRGDQARYPLSLPVLVKESMKLLKPTIPSWIELREQVANSTSSIEADVTDMRQMLVSLVADAVHAMRGAGGVLDIQLQDEELSTDLVASHTRVPAGRYVCLRVTDSSEGLDPQAAGHIEAPFLAVNPHGHGRGMGLSVARDIALAHGGALLVESRFGLSTTVAVYLPVLTACSPSVSGKEESLPRGHEGILFVAAEESRAKRGREMLESLGYYTVVRTNATQACETFSLAPQRFDLLIADRMMPDMTGCQLARECQRLRPDLPAILCADAGNTLSEEEVCSLGIAGVLTQPFVVQDVARLIRRVLDRSPQTHSALALSSAANGLQHEPPISLREV